MAAERVSCKLNNGIAMPTLGLGVFLSSPEETPGAVATALQDGYRLIDTAAAYLNERQVGEGIRRSGVARAELFITTKLWMTDYGAELTPRALDRSLRKLGLDYLDLYLLHWPVPSDFDRTIAAYLAAERLLAAGKVRAIGVSNFSAAHLRKLMERAKVVPAVNQIELHPFFVQRELTEVHRQMGIVTQAWSPIGGIYVRKPNAAPPVAKTPLEHPAVIALAAKYAKTPAQVVLRWHLEHGYSAIPKSVHSSRIAENFNVFDFALTPAEIAAVDALDTGSRAGSDPEKVDASSYAVTITDD